MRESFESDLKNGGRLSIATHRAELEVAPSEGGCITAFRWHGDDGVVDWLRAAPAGPRVAPSDSACYPLVPYSNRIRDGRFHFQGRDYRLARNFGASPHSIHGHAWQAPWQVAEVGDSHLILHYEHDAADWPAPYRAEQRFELVDESLQVEIAVTNLGHAAMPAGLGLHPYFPRTPLCRLSAEVGPMWATDDDIMPTELTSPPPRGDPGKGLLPDEIALDNCFTDFAGHALIHWPERRARLVIEADPALSFLVVFTPPGADFFCVEPVSHRPDAINQGAVDSAGSTKGDSGMKILQAGERFAATTRFLPRLDGAS